MSDDQEPYDESDWSSGTYDGVSQLDLPDPEDEP